MSGLQLPAAALDRSLSVAERRKALEAGERNAHRHTEGPTAGKWHVHDGAELGHTHRTTRPVIERRSAMTLATPTGRLPQRGTSTTTMPISQAHELGRIRGRRFVQIDGFDYELSGPLDDPSRVVAQAGEIRLVDREVRLIEGTPNSRQVTYRAFPAPGVYEALTAKTARRAAEVEARSKSRPVDVLGRLPLLARQPERIVDLGGASPREPLPLTMPAGTVIDGEAAAALLKMGAKTKAIVQAPKPAPRGGAAIVATLEAKGYSLSITPSGRLLVQARRGGLTDSVLDAIREAQRLIVGALTGHPVLCELEHSGKAPEAATIVAVDVAACEGHASGELALATANEPEAA